MRPEGQATGPIVWAVTQLGHFLRDGYREIRALVSANTPHNLKKIFSGSLLALILALLAVTVIASQLHPVVAVLAVACVLLIVYGRRLFQRLALFAGYFLCGFILFIGAGLIVIVPKGIPNSGEGRRGRSVRRPVSGYSFSPGNETTPGGDRENG